MRALWIVTLAAITGCGAPQTTVVFGSQPPGATLYGAGRQYGPMPLTLRFNRTPIAQAQGHLGEFSAHWQDGYSEKKQIRLAPAAGYAPEGWMAYNRIGQSFHVLFSRPYVPPAARPGQPRQQQPQPQQQQQQTVVVPGQPPVETEKLGTVIVSANVEGAEVFVDGLLVGNTPANLPLREGIHIIEVKKSGYVTYKRELRVLAGSEVALRATLKK